jgi:hypothetical protein
MRQALAPSHVLQLRRQRNRADVEETAVDGPLIATNRRNKTLFMTLFHTGDDMLKSVLTGTVAALSLGLTVFAQTGAGQKEPPAKPPATKEPASKQPSTGAAEQVTIMGCVQSESDYRRAKKIGRGGAANTGAGAGNEYVIVEASMAKGGGTGATGTAGAAAEAYEATGSGEGQLKQHVGKRVEITGKVKPAEKAAGKPTGGMDPMGKDLQLPELEVAKVKEATGDCKSAK